MSVLAGVLVELALGGAVVAALGGWWLARPAAYARVCAALASPSPGPREARAFPAAVLATGAAWVLIALAEVFPYSHGQRPYAVTVALVGVMALSAPAVVACLAWLALLRRWLVRR